MENNYSTFLFIKKGEKDDLPLYAANYNRRIKHYYVDDLEKVIKIANKLHLSVTFRHKNGCGMLTSLIFAPIDDKFMEYHFRKVINPKQSFLKKLFNL